MITALDKNTALVIIDLQKGITGRPTVHPVADIVAQNAKLVTAFHNAGLPVVAVNVNPIGAPAMMVRAEQGHPLPTDPAEQQKQYDAMNAGGFFDIVPELGIQPDDIMITKQTWSAFPNTGLHDELQKRGITGIVLTGVATSIGVEGTARSANEHGYNLTFVTDAMTDLEASAHEHALKLVFPRIGELGTTDELIAKLPA